MGLEDELLTDPGLGNPRFRTDTEDTSQYEFRGFLQEERAALRELMQAEPSHERRQTLLRQFLNLTGARLQNLSERSARRFAEFREAQRESIQRGQAHSR